jgi:LmbE family N-acetylglucosaminyl deacetylase
MKIVKNKFGLAALVIVAHPDDETIWMGGLIAKHKEIKWTIFSLCRSSDSDRAPKLLRVCKYFNARGIITDLDDEDNLTLTKSIPVIEALIKDNMPDQSFDFIFTHGINGEYGHQRHIGVNQAVNNLIKAKFLKPKAIFYFNYKKISQKEFSPLVYKNDSEVLFKLSDQEFRNKKKVVSDIYGFDPMGIDVSYCTNPEAFKFKILK